MAAINGLSQISEQFDAVAVDQYGVLHDGQTSFPDAVHCLQRLHAQGVPVVALTNSGKRAAYNMARLERLGFPQRLFRNVVSSGELARQLLEAMLGDGRLIPRCTVVVLSRDGEPGIVDDLPINAVSMGTTHRQPPSLLLIAGVEPERYTRDDYLAAIRILAKHDVPAICAAPDQTIYVAGGQAFGPGVVADDYAQAGGRVAVLGKPGKAIFEAALKSLGHPPAPRVLMIGDSPTHDIAGAASLGMKTLFISSGVQGALSSHITADYELTALRW